ncbi:HNH endonuclease signature motif containing protein, partial [Amycolatopsis sp.]
LGGPTDLNNLTLLCERHHRLIHCGGWEVRMGGDGRPDFIPPDYLDPLRRPRRNTCHL